MDTMEASALYDLADHMVGPGLFLPYEASRFVENTINDNYRLLVCPL